MNKIMEKISDMSMQAISEALLKLKKDEPREGVDLSAITKKLSAKRFGKK